MSTRPKRNVQPDYEQSSEEDSDEFSEGDDDFDEEDDDVLEDFVPEEKSESFTRQSEQELAKLKVGDLKELCRSRGLKVGGNKTELLSRLLGKEPTTTPKSARTKKTTPGKDSGVGSRNDAQNDKIIQKMKDLGIKDPCNLCLMVGIRKGSVPFENLDTVVCTCKCISCSKPFPITIKDCAEQSTYPGTDYEDGCESATFKCPECNEPQYITGLCMGSPNYDCGKFHNHCTQCPGGGVCIGDYREAHCHKCGKHYFSGLSGFACPCAERRRSGFGGGFGGGRRGRGEDCIIC